MYLHFVIEDKNTSSGYRYIQKEQEEVFVIDGYDGFTYQLLKEGRLMNTKDEVACPMLVYKDYGELKFGKIRKFCKDTQEAHNWIHENREDR